MLIVKRIILLVFLLISAFYPQDKIDPVYTGSFGSVTIYNQVYNQFSIRPEIAFGKFGLGLDIYFYIDDEGSFYDKSWDFSDGKALETLLDKVYNLNEALDLVKETAKSKFDETLDIAVNLSLNSG